VTGEIKWQIKSDATKRNANAGGASTTRSLANVKNSAHPKNIGIAALWVII